MIFELSIPQSLADLPGRLHVLEDEPVQATKTHSERLEQMRQYRARMGTLERRETERKYYEANREQILARRKARRAELLQDPEYRAQVAARAKKYREANREKMAAHQRAYYRRKNETRSSNSGPLTSSN